MDTTQYALLFANLPLKQQEWYFIWLWNDDFFIF